MERRPRVYIPNKGSHDYSKAKQFGDLVFITEGFRDKFALDKFFQRAVKTMHDASPDDYLMITSLNSICCICASILAYRFGALRMLLHRGNRYVEKVVVVSNLIERSDPFA